MPKISVYVYDPLACCTALGVWRLHHVFVMLTPFFSVSLQTLPSACEEGCSGAGSRLQATLTRCIFLLSALQASHHFELVSTSFTFFLFLLIEFPPAREHQVLIFLPQVIIFFLFFFFHGNTSLQRCHLNVNQSCSIYLKRK